MSGKTEATEERFRAIMEIIPDAVVVTDGAGYITFVNRQTEKLFGYARADLLGQPVERLIPERFRAAHLRHRSHYHAAPHTRPVGTNLQLCGRRRDGSDFPVDVSLSPLAEGTYQSGVLATIRDISERQRVERERAEAEAATEELRRVQAITDVALAHHTLDDLLSAILVRLFEVMRVDNAAIFLTENDQSALMIRAARGLEAAAAAQVRVPMGQGFAGRIAASRQPLFVEDLSTFPVVNPFLRESLRSALGVPLLVEDRLIGIIHIGSATPRIFSEREARLLQLVAERIALAIDQAQLRAAERAALVRAQVSEARFQRLMEGNVIGLIIIEGEAITEANEAFLDLIGHSREDLLAGRLRWRDLTPAEQIATSERAFQQVFTTGACVPFEKEYVRKDGSRVPVLVGSVLLEREPSRAIGFVVDLTERKWLERERQEADARELATREMNRQLDQFFSTAAHDIRNPITIIKANVQMAMRRFARLEVAAAGNSALQTPLAALKASLAEATEGTDRLTRLTARLFDVARARTGTLELRLAPCDLAALVREQVEAQRTTASTRTIELELPEDIHQAPISIEADADRLSQVLANYITNALKYSADEKPITVCLEVMEQRAIISVRDEGPGLLLDEQVRVWEMFHRAPGVEVQGSTEGTNASMGLGLHICKRIIELHHGRVGVESAVGEGSTFWFSLPLCSGMRERRIAR